MFVFCLYYEHYLLLLSCIDHLHKGNYRPVSILTTFSKLLEQRIVKQLQTHFEGLLTMYLLIGKGIAVKVCCWISLTSGTLPSTTSFALEHCLWIYRNILTDCRTPCSSLS